MEIKFPIAHQVFVAEARLRWEKRRKFKNSNLPLVTFEELVSAFEHKLPFDQICLQLQCSRSQAGKIYEEYLREIFGMSGENRRKILLLERKRAKIEKFLVECGHYQKQ